MGVEGAYAQRIVYPWRTGVLVHASTGEGNKPPESEKIPAGKITSKGPLRSVAGGSKHSWKGNISADTIRSNGHSEKIDQYTNPDKLETYYMSADATAPMRCVDGRTSDVSKGKIDRGEKIEDERSVGPMIPGGTPGSALAHRIIMDADPEGVTLSHDIETVVKEFDTVGISIGGHIDHNHNGHDHNGDKHDLTGCGAIDRIPEIFDILDDHHARTQIKTLTQALLGNEYNGETVAHIFNNIARLHGKRDNYLEKKGKTYKYRDVAIDSLKKHNPNSVEKMVGPHREVAIVVNTVENTTLNRARLNQDTGGDVQVFNYDVWASRMIANKLYPNNPEMQARYLTCRVMLAIATMMALTDGSVTLMVRTENGKSGSGKKENPSGTEGRPDGTTPKEGDGKKTPETPKGNDGTATPGAPNTQGEAQGGTTFRTPQNFGERRKNGSGFMTRIRESFGNMFRSIGEGIGRAAMVPVRSFKNLVEYIVSRLPFSGRRGIVRHDSGEPLDTEVIAGGFSMGGIAFSLIYIPSVLFGSPALVPAIVVGSVVGLLTAFANYAHNNELFA